mgnify:CR=1 FL=1
MTAATTITETASALADITVYAGPGESAYAAIGSIGLTESFLSINDELGFRYIEYDVTGSTKKKRGYIVDVLAANTYPGDFATGRKGTAKSGVTVYTGPSSANYVTAGSLSSGESFTYLTYNPAATMQFVEYSTASGSLQEEEYCVILAKTTYFYLVEYNTRNGRKTAYANKQDLTVIGDASSVPDDSGISSNAAMSVSSTVYGGPSTKIFFRRKKHLLSGLLFVHRSRKQIHSNGLLNVLILSVLPMLHNGKYKRLVRALHINIYSERPGFYISCLPGHDFICIFPQWGFTPSPMTARQ